MIKAIDSSKNKILQDKIISIDLLASIDTNKDQNFKENPLFNIVF